MIYFDNAATTLIKPGEVAQAVKEAINSLGNASRGAHLPSLRSLSAVTKARGEITEFFGGKDPKRTVFTLNSTMALNMAIDGMVKPRDHVITTCMEHNSVLRPLYRKEKEGTELSILSCDGNGNISYKELEKSIKKNTKAVVITHASNVTGNGVDVKEVGHICSKNGIYLIVDASQSAGVIPIDMEDMGIDALCFTGHKGLLGPMGTGGLMVSENVEIRPFLVGGSGVHSFDRDHPGDFPEHLEAGTLNAHGIAGLLAALEWRKGRDLRKDSEYERMLSMRFYEGIRDLPRVKTYGDFSLKERVPVVSFNIGDCDSSLVADELFERFCICTRAGAHCAPLMHEAFGTVDQGMVRFSFSVFNTEEEIDEGIRAVKILAGE